MQGASSSVRNLPRTLEGRTWQVEPHSAGGAALGRSIYVLLDERNYITHTEGKVKWTDPSTFSGAWFLFFFSFGAWFLTS